jgi:putative hydrolase of the HAD superfamily
VSAPIHGIDPVRVQAAVFDLGGVFLAGGPEAVAGFGDRHGIAADAWTAIRRDLFHHQTGLWCDVERGTCTFDDFIDRLRTRAAEHGIQVPLEDARNFMLNTGDSARERLRPEIVAAAARIHERIPTALLTNNIREWRDEWRVLIDVDALFDVVVDSSEIGARKPDPPIYEVTRERLGVPHDALFFLDDIGANLKVARALGWQTLRYDDTARVLEVLDAIAAAKPPRPRADRPRR